MLEKKTKREFQTDDENLEFSVVFFQHFVSTKYMAFLSLVMNFYKIFMTSVKKAIYFVFTKWDKMLEKKNKENCKQMPKIWNLQQGPYFF